jgi:hypothetical protein
LLVLSPKKKLFKTLEKIQRTWTLRWRNSSQFFIHPIRHLPKCMGFQYLNLPQRVELEKITQGLKQHYAWHVGFQQILWVYLLVPHIPLHHQQVLDILNLVTNCNTPFWSQTHSQGDIGHLMSKVGRTSKTHLILYIFKCGPGQTCGYLQSPDIHKKPSFSCSTWCFFC